MTLFSTGIGFRAGLYHPMSQRPMGTKNRGMCLRHIYIFVWYRSARTFCLLQGTSTTASHPVKGLCSTILETISTVWGPSIRHIHLQLRNSGRDRAQAVPFNPRQSTIKIRNYLSRAIEQSPRLKRNIVNLSICVCEKKWGTWTGNKL